jgi:hypothetical protein
MTGWGLPDNCGWITPGVLGYCIETPPPPPVPGPDLPPLDLSDLPPSIELRNGDWGQGAVRR